MNKEPIFETENILVNIENKPAFFAHLIAHGTKANAHEAELCQVVLCQLDP